MQPHKVRRPRLSPRAAHHPHDLPALHVPLLLQNQLGHIDQLVRILEAIAQDRDVPHSIIARLITASSGESAKIGGSGLYFESSRAVWPDSVKIAIAARFRSSAECAMHSQIVSATESRVVRGLRGTGGGSNRICSSVSTTIFAIISTAFPAPRNRCIP
jgi:hypothetical protein